MSDIFNQEETNSNNEAANQTNVDDITKALMEIKREDGTPKYTDPVEALKALQASQNHIRQIEADNASLREKANKVDSLEETLKRLGENNNNGKPNPKTEDEGGRSVEAAEELVAKLLDKKLQERDAVNTAVSNVKRVNDALVQKFGNPETAGKAVDAKAKSLNTTPQALKELAAQNPNLVLELFGSSTAASSLNIGSVNLGGQHTQVEEIKAPEQSLLSGPGATHSNQLEYFRKIKANVNKRLNVEN